MYKQNRDFTKILEFLEDQHRHDVPVHLLLTHLLHRVNPNFPPPSWANWPKPPDEVPVPKDNYADSPLVEAELCTGDMAEKDDKIVDYPNDRNAQEWAALAFKRSSRKINISRKLPHHKAHNEMLFHAIHSTVIRRIRQKCSHARDRLSDDGDVASETAGEIALTIYSRLRRLLKELRKAKARPRTWQDIHIANILSRSRSILPDVDSYKESYDDARHLFHDLDYQHHYDALHYENDSREPASDDENDYVATVPKFNVRHHLDTINGNDDLDKTQKLAEEELDRRKKRFEKLDDLFRHLWNEAAQLAQISWQNNYAPVYKITEGPHAPLRSIMLSKPLQKDDFTINFTN